MKKTDIQKITTIGLMAALVYVGTFLRIKIPAGPDGTMLHFGNVFCLLAGILFGPITGGLSAGFGSAIFDLTSEYASSAWITFINKFAMGFVAGLVSKHLPKNLNHTLANAISAMCGSLTYCLLYITKTYIWSRWVYAYPLDTIPAIIGVKSVVTLINGIIAVVCSVIFAKALKAPLQKMNIETF